MGHIYVFKFVFGVISLVVQSLRLHASTEGTDLVPGWGTKILRALMWQKN